MGQSNAAGIFHATIWSSSSPPQLATSNMVHFLESQLASHAPFSLEQHHRKPWILFTQRRDAASRQPAHAPVSHDFQPFTRCDARSRSKRLSFVPLGLMPNLESIMNSLTDKDWGWRPFLFLRPRRDEDICNITLLKMAACFGPLIAALVLAVRFLMREPISIASAGVCLVVCCTAFFVGYRSSFAISWNRRARRLPSSEAPVHAKTWPKDAANHWPTQAQVLLAPPIHPAATRAFARGR